MGKSSVWVDPRYAEFIRQHTELTMRQLHRAFADEYGKDVARSLNQFRMFAYRIREGGEVVPPKAVPLSSKRILAEDILRLNCRAALITSDWQIPFHDGPWADFAFEIGKGFGCDLHVINGDFLDFHSIAKFDPQVHDDVDSIEEELDYAEQILSHSCQVFGTTVMDLGNHEWRLYRALLHAQIGPARLLKLMGASERVQLTEFSYVILNERVRCTHPRNFSKIPTRVGAELAAKYHQDVVAAHGHLIGSRRDISGQFTVIDSGGMFDPRRLDYINTVDSINPLVNQGFVILTPGGELLLFDAAKTDREWWLHLARKGYLTSHQPSPASLSSRSQPSGFSRPSAPTRRARASAASAATA